MIYKVNGILISCLIYVVFIKICCFLDETSRVSESLNYSSSCFGEHQFYEEPDPAYPYDNISPRDQGVALFFQSNVRPNSSEIKHLGEIWELLREREFLIKYIVWQTCMSTKKKTTLRTLLLR